MPQDQWSTATLAAPAPTPASASRKKERDAPSIAMLKVARAYFNFTGRHLPIYQQLAWHHAAEKFGIALHDKRDNGGTQGCLGNTRVVIRLIGPARETSAAVVAKTSNFSALVIVKIGADFSISAKWIARRDLPVPSKHGYVIPWSQAIKLPGARLAGTFETNKGNSKDTPHGSREAICKRLQGPGTLRLLYRRLLRLAREFPEQCPTRALPLYGPLGEIYAACAFGMTLHPKANQQGSDGKLGRLLLEVKTIGPKDGGTDGRVKVKKAGNFSALVIVMIGKSFNIHAKMIRRKRLPAAEDGLHTVPWKNFTCDYRELLLKA